MGIALDSGAARVTLSLALGALVLAVAGCYVYVTGRAARRALLARLSAGGPEGAAPRGPAAGGTGTARSPLSTSGCAAPASAGRSG